MAKRPKITTYEEAQKHNDAMDKRNIDFIKAVANSILDLAKAAGIKKRSGFNVSDFRSSLDDVLFSSYDFEATFNDELVDPCDYPYEDESEETETPYEAY